MRKQLINKPFAIKSRVVPRNFRNTWFVSNNSGGVCWNFHQDGSVVENSLRHYRWAFFPLCDITLAIKTGLGDGCKVGICCWKSFTFLVLSFCFSFLIKNSITRKQHFGCNWHLNRSRYILSFSSRRLRERAFNPINEYSSTAKSFHLQSTAYSFPFH